MEDNNSAKTLPSPDHYGRNTFETRLKKLKSNEQAFSLFEAALSQAGTSVEQLTDWIASPDLLEEKNVASFMQKLATIMMGMHTEGGNFDIQAEHKKLENELVSLIKTTF